VRKAGRQFIEIDEDKLEKLAALGLTNAECAAILDCSPDTLERNYKETMAWGRSHRDASLRRKQFEIALAGNPTMLIWLGKQYLGQSDKTPGESPENPIYTRSLNDFYAGLAAKDDLKESVTNKSTGLNRRKQTKRSQETAA
jgi:hypothetical protein